MDDAKLQRINIKIKEHLSNCAKHMELYLSFLEKNKLKDTKKKLEIIKKELDIVKKLIFENKISSDLIYNQIIELDIIKIFVSYCSLQEETLLQIFLPFIQKLIFPQNISNLDEEYELLLMNSSTINSVKILNDILLKMTKKTENENILEITINFIDELLRKFVIYPNFYFSISSTNLFFIENLNSSNSSNSEKENAEKDFDSELFELIVEIFSKEFFLPQREIKSKLRKSILLCLNLENFYKIKKQILYNLFNYFIENLICYYVNYKNFEIDLPKKNLMKKENISQGDLEEIYKCDVISYLKFMDIFIRCLEDSDLKFIFKAKFFSKFLLEFVQNDLIYLQKLFNPFSEKVLLKLMEFVFFICKYLNNNTISELVFSFVFGFDNINVNKERKIISENLNMENQDYLEYDKSALITCTEDQHIIDDLNFDSIRKNLNKLDEKRRQSANSNNNNNNNNNNLNKNKASFFTDDIHINNNPVFPYEIEDEILAQKIKDKHIKKLTLDISNYNNEAILGFFIKVIKSESVSEMVPFKIILLNIITKIIKNCSGLFLIEILLPFYLNFINTKTPKSFDILVEKLTKFNERFFISEIIGLLLPKYLSMNFIDWENFFQISLEENYKRNSDLLEKELILKEKNVSENLEKFCENSNAMNLNFENIEIVDLNNLNYSRGTLSNDSNIFMEESLLDSNFNNNLQHKFGYFLNVSELRINFYESLILYFKKFNCNNFEENIFLSKLFLEIFSMPMISNLGENGNKIYNIYHNITYYNLQSNFLFKISAVGILFEIGKSLDEFLMENKTNNKECASNGVVPTTIIEDKKSLWKMIRHKRNFSNTEINISLDSSFTSSGLNTINGSDVCDKKLLQNSKLFIETFKEFVANLYCKRYFDMINFNNLNYGLKV